MTKRCCRCGESKPHRQYHKNRSQADGLHHECKDCRCHLSRIDHYKRKYGITLEQYDQMLAEQDYECAACGSTDPGGKGRFHVDHNHDTGEVRGLLCLTCNVAYGQLEESPRRITALLDYHFRYTDT